MTNKIKRLRTSMYDQYKDEIDSWCKTGMTVKEMANRLGAGYSPQGLYTYIRKKGLRGRPWVDVYEARNACSKCEYCHEYLNTNNGAGRICSKSWRTISPNVVYRPVWCELEKGNERDQSNK